MYQTFNLMEVSKLSMIRMARVVLLSSQYSIIQNKSDNFNVTNSSFGYHVLTVLKVQSNYVFLVIPLLMSICILLNVFYQNITYLCSSVFIFFN